jgi:hypothetical protein
LLLTFFLTAFAPGFAPLSHVCLATGKILIRIYCPDIGLEIFDHMLTLQSDLFFYANISPELPEATAAIESWLPRVKNVLEHPESSIEVRHDTYGKF